MSASVALTCRAVARRSSAKRRRATTSPGPQVRAAVGEAELSGRAAARCPPASTTSTHSSTRASCAAVRVGVHPHRTADRAGDVDAELDPGQPRLSGAGRHRRQPGAAATVASGFRRARSCSVPCPVSGPIRGRRRPLPAGSTPSRRPLPRASRVRPREQPLELARPACAREQLGRAARADRGQPRQRVVALHPGWSIGHRAQGRWRSGGLTPRRSDRAKPRRCRRRPSPGTDPRPASLSEERARVLELRAARRLSGHRRRRRRRRRSVARRRRGSPRRVRAPDRHRARRPGPPPRAPRRTPAQSARVREYRCGWNTATSRVGASVRAAAIAAATSVGWWA